MLGWRSDHSLVELVYPGQDMDDGADLREVSLTDGSTHGIARFANPRMCEGFTARCRVEYDVQAATSLLPRMQVGPSPSPWWWPDRGLLQLRLHLYTLILHVAAAPWLYRPLRRPRAFRSAEVPPSGHDAGRHLRPV